jgi:integrase
MVDWSEQLIRVMKEVAEIKQHNSKLSRATSEFVFGKEHDGEPYADDGFSTLWNRLMHSYAPSGKTSADWFTAHDLRAFYVTEMLKGKRDPKTHANLETMIKIYEREQLIEVSPLA